MDGKVWRGRSHRTGAGSRSLQLAVPAEVGRSLPDVAEWDLVVTADGLLLRFVGAAEKKKKGECTPTVALPFLDGKEVRR